MSEPSIQKIGDSLWLVWPSHQVSMEFAYFRDTSDGCSAEVTITQTTTGLGYWARVNLASAQGRGALVRGATTELGPSLPWSTMIQAGCKIAMEHVRKGHPAETVTPGPLPAGQWFIDRLIPAHETSVIFGDGGSGKSLLVLALGMAALSGHMVGRWHPTACQRLLYLDWESCKAEQESRMWGLAELNERLPVAPPVLYRAMTRPLTDEIVAIRREVAQHGVDLVICDSLGPACGAEPESADAAVRAMNALRSLPTATRLVIAHMSKAAADLPKGAARPFGSVYVQNLARSVIEVRRTESEEQDTLALSLYHRKVNAGPLAPASGLRFLFDAAGHITVRAYDPDLSRSSLPAQIRDALLLGHKTGTTLAKELGASPAAVKKQLERMANRDIVVRITGTSGGQGKETLWGLALKPGQGNRDSG